MTDAGQGSTALLILDSCVLIDYIKAEPALFSVIAGNVGPVHVATIVFEEVAQLTSLEHMEDLGITLIEPEIEDAFEAERMKGRTSFQDNICLLTAKKHNMTCVTNDKSLRKTCSKHDVPTMWGLELLLHVVRSGGLDHRSAVEIGRRIHASNPRHISLRVVTDFERKVLS